MLFLTEATGVGATTTERRDMSTLVLETCPGVQLAQYSKISDKTQGSVPTRIAISRFVSTIANTIGIAIHEYGRRLLPVL